MTFAGDADNCVITSADANVGSGGSTAVTVNFWSDTDQTVPVPDYRTIVGTGAKPGDPTITAVNSVGSGTFAVTGLTAPVGGSMGATLTVGASGGTGVLATMGGTAVTCNTNVNVGTFVEPPSSGGGGGMAGFTGEFPTSGFATVTFTGTIAEMDTALGTSCSNGAPVFGSQVVAGVGTLLPYFSTTSLSAPNAAFETAFSGGLDNAALIVGNCA